MNKITSKFWEARSRLYRSWFLQVNTKFSCQSSWRDLKDLYTFAPLRPQNVTKQVVRIFSKWILIFLFSTFRVFQNFSPQKYSYAQFWWNVVGISRYFPENALQEHIEIIIWKKVFPKITRHFQKVPKL